MKARALVPEPLLTGAESTEVLCSLGNYVVVEIEDDLSGWACMCHISQEEACGEDGIHHR